MGFRRGISKATNRSLKPVIEKKRRDRINQSLHELRTLLLSHTRDTRLQNPKLEKAEILELTVEYIKNKTHREATSHSPGTGVRSGCVAGAGQYSAGFQQCVSRLSSFMDCVNPAQRRSLARGLQHCLGSPGSSPQGPENPPPPPPLASLPLYPTAVVLPPPYPSPPYSLSPPPSPCYTNSTPNFLSTTGHFLFPPTLSPLSSDSSSFSSSSPPPLPTRCPAFPLLLAPPPPSSAPPTPQRPAALPSPTKRGQREALRRELFPLPAESVWRPWS